MFTRFQVCNYCCILTLFKLLCDYLMMVYTSGGFEFHFTPETRRFLNHSKLFHSSISCLIRIPVGQASQPTFEPTQGTSGHCQVCFDFGISDCYWSGALPLYHFGLELFFGRSGDCRNLSGDCLPLWPLLELLLLRQLYFQMFHSIQSLYEQYQILLRHSRRKETRRRVHDCDHSDSSLQGVAPRSAHANLDELHSSSRILSETF